VGWEFIRSIIFFNFIGIIFLTSSFNLTNNYKSKIDLIIENLLFENAYSPTKVVITILLKQNKLFNLGEFARSEFIKISSTLQITSIKLNIVPSGIFKLIKQSFYFSS